MNGPDDAPEPMVIPTPAWPAAIAHMAGPMRPGAPFVLDPHAYETDEPVDLRCCSCRARNVMIPDPASKVILFVAVHEPGCAGMADQLEMQRRQPPTGAA